MTSDAQNISQPFNRALWKHAVSIIEIPRAEDALQRSEDDNGVTQNFKLEKLKVILRALNIISHLRLRGNLHAETRSCVRKVQAALGPTQDRLRR